MTTALVKIKGKWYVEDADSPPPEGGRRPATEEEVELWEWVQQLKKALKDAHSRILVLEEAR